MKDLSISEKKLICGGDKVCCAKMLEGHAFVRAEYIYIPPHQGVKVYYDLGCEYQNYGWNTAFEDSCEMDPASKWVNCTSLFGSKDCHCNVQPCCVIPTKQ